MNAMERRRELWKRRVAEWEASGESQKAFCVRMGLRAASLSWWRGRLATEECRALVEVPRAGRTVEGGAEPLRIRLREGVEISVAASSDLELLRRVVRALAGEL